MKIDSCFNELSIKLVLQIQTKIITTKLNEIKKCERNKLKHS